MLITTVNPMSYWVQRIRNGVRNIPKPKQTTMLKRKLRAGRRGKEGGDMEISNELWSARRGGKQVRYNE